VATLLHALHLRIPADISLIGFDDIANAHLIAGGLTTIHQPIQAMAIEAVRKIDLVGAQEGMRPIIFSTLVQEDVRNVVRGSSGFFLDFFDPFLAPLENELKTQSTHVASRTHRMADTHAYATRIDATNFALANDDGSVVRDYERADVILVGVSRSGKTPTCLYLAMQYGIFAANFPLTEDDLESRKLPPALEAYSRKLFALTIKPDRLQQIRNERRPDSRSSSSPNADSNLSRAARSPVAAPTPWLTAGPSQRSNCSISAARSSG